MGMKSPELHQTIKDWDADMEDKAGEAAETQGDIQYRYPDGWTVQRLTTPQQLKEEGNSMGHCVGGYAPAVQAGKSLIYSLRDHQNQPHATWEIGPQSHECPQCGEFVRPYTAPPGGGDPHADCGYTGSSQPSPRQGNMIQIQGKGNKPPIPEYQDRIRQYFEDTMPDITDRPTWEDQDHYDWGDLDPTYDEDDGYTAYHPGNYGLMEPNRYYAWHHLIDDAANPDTGYGTVEPEKIVEKANEAGELAELEDEANRWKGGTEDGTWARNYANELQTAIEAAKLPQVPQGVSTSSAWTQMVSHHHILSTELTCEVCGDPLTDGKCKRCNWGGWSNTPDPKDPISDATKDVKPAIQS